jgi:putative oxidoreductase
MSLFNKSKDLWHEITSRLNSAGDVFPALFLRLILFWEFWESGVEKYNGSNWFASMQDSFPFPFNVIDPSISWFMATWGELVFSVLLLLGLFTRFAAFSLLIITVVATAAVHWPESWSTLSELWKGYAISGKGFGNYKLPLLFAIMLMPLIFNGAGKLSLDNFLSKMVGCPGGLNKMTDLATWGLSFLAIGLPLSFIMPIFGIGLVVLGMVLLVVNKFITPA